MHKSKILFNIMFFFIMIAAIYLPIGYAVSTPVNPNQTQASPTPTEQPVPIGRVAWVTGNLTGQLPNQPARPLKRASLFYLHDTLTTSANSQAEIVYTDNSLTSFRPNTTIHVDQYQFNPQQPVAPTGKQVTSLVQGGLREVTGWVGKSHPENYQMNTPVATIGVRGTDYSIVYDPIKGLMVNLNGGKIVLTNASGKLELDQSTKQVYALVASIKTPPTLLTTKPPVFKTDPPIIPAKIGSTPLPTPANVAKAALIGTTTTTSPTTPTGKSVPGAGSTQQQLNSGGGCTNDLDISTGGA